MNFKRNFIMLILALVFNSNIFCISEIPFSKGIKILKTSYPDIIFSYKFDESLNDWEITFQAPLHKNSSTLYWANGKMLPKTELSNSDKYWPILYKVSEVKDPATMTNEEKSALKEFSSSENRRSGAGTPMFFFDALYDSSTRASLEQRLKSIEFLGKQTTVHERIVEPLKKVNDKILQVSKSNAEVKNFLDNLKSADAYYWRVISGTNRKSFHSLGIALDVLPKSYGGKEVFWSWAKDKNPETWMLTPLSSRWMPPKDVIKIFKDEGFIWGGNWGIWDNMHFEYHPELIEFSK